MPEEHHSREGLDSDDCASVAESTLVPEDAHNAHGSPIDISQVQQFISTLVTRQATSLGPVFASSEIVRESGRSAGLSEETASFITVHVKLLTRNTTNTSSSGWIFVLKGRSISVNPPPSMLMDFFTFLFRVPTFSVGQLKRARTALSFLFTSCGVPNITEHHFVQKFIKSAFQTRPPKPHLKVTWNPRIVLDHIKNLPPSSWVNIRHCARRALMLLLLSTACRKQEILLMDIRPEYMLIEENMITFSLTKPCKNFSAENPNQGFQLIHVRKNLKERDLCPYTAVYHYLKLTAYKHSSTTLFVSSLPLFAAAKSGTLLNWAKQLMEPHSTRAAATSNAYAAGLPLDTILGWARWTSSDSFVKHYHKPLLSADAATFRRQQDFLLHSRGIQPNFSDQTAVFLETGLFPIVKDKPRHKTPLTAHVITMSPHRQKAKKLLKKLCKAKRKNPSVGDFPVPKNIEVSDPLSLVSTEIPEQEPVVGLPLLDLPLEDNLEAQLDDLSAQLMISLDGMDLQGTQILPLCTFMWFVH